MRDKSGTFCVVRVCGYSETGERDFFNQELTERQFTLLSSIERQEVVIFMRNHSFLCFCGTLSHLQSDSF